MSGKTQYNLNYLKVSGRLLVKSITPRELKGKRVRVCILMGPTGSGKSAFIEALAPHQGLSISGESLESITQNVVFYRVENLQDGGLPVILMDTPGLLDPCISESRVVGMISKELDMLRASAEMAVVTLCYFHPIDVARVGGTKRGAVEFLQGFAQTFKANNVNIITTMWNMLWNEKLSTAAELRFEALKVEIYKGLPSLNVSLERFNSTAASTLSILNACRHGWYHTTRKQRISLPTYDNMVLQGLVERIQNIQQELANLAQDDHQLPVIREAEDKAARLLYEFCCDLHNCDPHCYREIFPNAPCPPKTFASRPSLSKLRCYLSMSPLKIGPVSEPTLALSFHRASGLDILVPSLEPTEPVHAVASPVLNVHPDLAAVISKLQHLTVIGDISVERVIAEIPENAKVYVIMGPTGVGKSSLIECLAGEGQYLGISKDQLAGYTHTVNAYHVVNVLNNACPIIMLDTPSISDSKTSELEIMNMIPEWMKRNGLPGSRRRTVAMLEDLLRATHDFDSICMITTMWDTLHNERTQRRAESNFSQLRDQTFRQFFGGGADITRFVNTKASALKILDRPLHKKRAFDIIGFTATLRLYQDLHERIEGAIQAKQIIELDLSEPEVQTNLKLKAILDRNFRSNEQVLDKFIEQFIEYGDPPTQLADRHQRLCKDLLSVRPELLHRLPPSSLTSDNTTPMVAGDQINETMQAESRKGELAPQDTVQIVDRQQSETMGFSGLLRATKDRLKSLPGFRQ